MRALAGRRGRRGLRGDLLHTPAQILDPSASCAFDLDPDAACVSRRAALERAAASGVAVVPAHLPGHGGASVRARREGFAIERWLDLPEV